MSVLQKLTEGIQERSLSQEGAALLDKWERTGLLEGLTGESQKNGMARLLENQASQLLKEVSAMAAGDVEGFAAVAFPLVRRVFGGLIANDLVSVQPMSLPSGLIFFMDFQLTDTKLGYTEGQSVYGGGVVASQITGGLSELTEDGGGFYNLNNGYASATGSLLNNLTVKQSTAAADCTQVRASIDAGDPAAKSWIRYDADIASGTFIAVYDLAVTGTTDIDRMNFDDLIAFNFAPTSADAGVSWVRRLTTRPSASSAPGTFRIVATHATAVPSQASKLFNVDFPEKENFAASNALGSVVGQDPWGLEQAGGASTGVRLGTNVDIPEIDIKVDSVAVTAITKKLKAKWTPELGQDLNAYHNLDAEVELTSILSEQIALEIDQEILNDLVQGATAGKYYWSRSPGLFVNRTTGQEIGAASAAPDFTGTVSEWYETLVETINDVSAQIHRKTLRGGANFIVCGPELANILEFTSGFRASVTADDNRGTVGAVKVGSLTKKFDVYVDPYFLRNVVLVGRKGSSFLESGYVYAPYVPLQVTPTIFGTEDFVPRKGVMTRYAKKMVRPDMYGLVVVRGLLGEAGATS